MKVCIWPYPPHKYWLHGHWPLWPDGHFVALPCALCKQCAQCTKYNNNWGWSLLKCTVLQCQQWLFHPHHQSKWFPGLEGFTFSDEVVRSFSLMKSEPGCGRDYKRAEWCGGLHSRVDLCRVAVELGYTELGCGPRRKGSDITLFMTK